MANNHSPNNFENQPARRIGPTYTSRKASERREIVKGRAEEEIRTASNWLAAALTTIFAAGTYGLVVGPKEFQEEIDNCDGFASIVQAKGKEKNTCYTREEFFNFANPTFEKPMYATLVEEINKAQGTELVYDAQRAQRFSQTNYFEQFNMYAQMGSHPIELMYAIATLESARNPYEENKGDQGIMQLSPATRKDYRIANGFDLEQSLQGGSRRLAELEMQFNGDLQAMAAAYNFGHNGLARIQGKTWEEKKGKTNRAVRQYAKKAELLYTKLSEHNGIFTEELLNKMHDEVIEEGKHIQ